MYNRCIICTVGIEGSIVAENHPARKVGLRYRVRTKVGEPRSNIEMRAAVILRG